MGHGSLKRGPGVRPVPPGRPDTPGWLLERMEFDSFTVSVLESVPNAPTLSEAESYALQDAHMAFLAGLHEAGDLQAAGPTVTPPDRTIRGFSIYRLPEDRVRELMAMDPAIRAGRLAVRIFTWLVPKGAVSFSAAPFPHSQAEL